MPAVGASGSRPVVTVGVVVAMRLIDHVTIPIPRLQVWRLVAMVMNWRWVNSEL